MKDLIKQLMGESAIYGLSGIISRFISIFLVPLYTSIFTTADYGIMNLIGSFFFFVNIFVVFALDNSASRWYYDTTDEKDQKTTISSWFWFQLGVSTILCCIIIILSGFLSRKLLSQSDPLFFIIPSLSVITNVFTTIVSNWFRMRRKAVQTVAFNLSFSILTILLTVYFVVYLKKGVLGVFYATLISNALSSLICLFILKSWISIRFFSLNRLKEMLHFSLPLIPTALCFWVINSSSSFILNMYCDLDEVGLFQLGVTISTAITLVTSSFQMAWGPFAYSILSKENAKQVYSFVLSAYSIIANLLALGVALFAEDILILLTNPAYYGAYFVAGILTFNATIYSYVYIVGIGNGIVKNNKPLAIAVFISACITLLSIFLLTPFLGKTGTALGMLIGNLFIPVYVYFSAQKNYPIPYNAPLVLILILSAFTLFSLYMSLRSDSYITNLIIKSIMLLAYVFIILINIKIHEPVLFEKARSFFKKRTMLNE